MIIKVKHEDVTLRTFMLLIQMAYALLKYTDAHLYVKQKLSTIKFIVLHALHINGGTMTCSGIAYWTNRERHDITTLVERMKRDGLVVTERDKKDRRYVHVSLTDKGYEVLHNSRDVTDDIAKRVMSSIDKDDLVLLEKTLELLRQNAHDGLEKVSNVSKT